MSSISYGFLMKCLTPVVNAFVHSATAICHFYAHVPVCFRFGKIRQVLAAYDCRLSC